MTVDFEFDVDRMFMKNRLACRQLLKSRHKRHNQDFPPILGEGFAERPRCHYDQEQRASYMMSILLLMAAFPLNVSLLRRIWLEREKLPVLQLAMAWLLLAGRGLDSCWLNFCCTDLSMLSLVK
eukprot:g55027.t1